MPNPKRRHSRTRRDKRRANWKAAVPKLTQCPHCHEPRMPHRVCKNCGYYNGKAVVS